MDCRKILTIAKVCLTIAKVWITKPLSTSKKNRFALESYRNPNVDNIKTKLCQ